MLRFNNICASKKISLILGSRKSLVIPRIKYSTNSKDSKNDDHSNKDNNTFLDHRSIGTAQQLFAINPLTPGSVLFLPHGARIFNTLIQFMRKQQKVYGFDEVISPILYKKDLWKMSGHWENFNQDMFHLNGEEDFSLKPMNCPGHCLMYKSTIHSFRDLPIRFSDFSPLHRNESSGALSGLTRVRRFHQDDGHIFCTFPQISNEILSTLRLIESTYKLFKIPSYRLLLSTRPEKFIGKLEEWDLAENGLKEALNATGKHWDINQGDGAFYGPKIDILLKDSNGKEHQTATIQLDFQLPTRFNLQYSTDNPDINKQPVMIHRAVYGSVERFMAILIELYQGNWPFWLSPRQGVIIPISERHNSYAYDVQKVISGASKDLALTNDNNPAQMQVSNFFIDVDSRSESVSHRVKSAIENKYNYILTIGDKELEQNKVSLRSRTDRKQFLMSPESVYEKFIALQDNYE